MQRPRQGMILPDRLHVETSEGQSDVAWSDFVDVAKSGDLPLLYRVPMIFQILAKEFVASAQEWQQARSFVVSHVKHE